MEQVSQLFIKLLDKRVFIIRGTEDKQEASKALTEHLEGKTGQLSLWDESGQIHVIPFNIGDVADFSTYWADGDTSPASLQRLASSLMKRLYSPGPYGWRIVARVLSTRIEDGRVWMQCERVEFPIKGVDSDDDEEEVNDDL